MEDSLKSSQTPLLKKSTSGSQSAKSQQSIVGFFQKRTSASPSSTANDLPKINGARLPINGAKTKKSTRPAIRGPSSSLTPAPSSDALEDFAEDILPRTSVKTSSEWKGLPSPITPASASAARDGVGDVDPAHFNSPSRKVRLYERE